MIEIFVSKPVDFPNLANKQQVSIYRYSFNFQFSHYALICWVLQNSFKSDISKACYFDYLHGFVVWNIAIFLAKIWADCYAIESDGFHLGKRVITMTTTLTMMVIMLMVLAMMMMMMIMMILMMIMMMVVVMLLLLLMMMMVIIIITIWLL